ncbi:hypothetical protein DPMN_017171 [Dreissena polymorpha]|uniref:Sema domain-containing protein n=1 Tax=Dreissena polymorpha TaxID=45954 RepID=A0A9D4NAX2_DREPO|nr:hypothetical protein DPMN_017171 [Dreissena polymorpha]
MVKHSKTTMMSAGKTCLCLLWLVCCVFSGSVNGQGRILIGSLDTNLGLTGMVAVDNDTLIVAGRNFICSINTSAANENQTVIQTVTTGLNRTLGFNDVTVAMIYSSETKHFITCESNHDKCDIINVYNISQIIASIPFSIKRHETASMILRDGTNDYVFVARPLKDAGLVWYKLNNNFDEEENKIPFKFGNDNVTVIFVKAVSVNQFRLFFSQQFVINEGKYVSRVAQICQKTDKDAMYTRDTFMDMPLECGDLRQLEVVEYIRQSKLFVAAFRRGSNAAICLYNFKDIQDK